jgi:hypothetical protein
MQLYEVEAEISRCNDRMLKLQISAQNQVLPNPGWNRVGPEYYTQLNSLKERRDRLEKMRAELLAN